MPYAHKQTRSPATICATIVLGLLAFATVVGLISSKAFGAERDKCSITRHHGKTTSTCAPIHITAKPTAKTEKPTVVSMVTYSVTAEPGQTVPKAKTDVDLATKRDATVEGHVVMRLAAVSGE